MVKRYLLPAIKGDSALPEDPAGRAKLAQAVRRLDTVGKYESQQPTPQAEALSKRTFVLEPNDWRLREFALALSGPEPSFRLEQAARTFPFSNTLLGGPMGLQGDYVVSRNKFEGPIALRGRWINGDTFRTEAQQLEGSIVAEWTAEFADGELKLSYVDGDGRAFKTRGSPKE
jgi:hypothetical protein